MKKIWATIFAFVYLLLLITPFHSIASATHEPSKNFTFHWVDRQNIEMYDASDNKTVIFKYFGERENGNIVVFEGIFSYLSKEPFNCPGNRGISFDIKKSLYTNIDTAKGTAIDRASYSNTGNGTCDRMDAIIETLKDDSTRVGVKGTFIEGDSEGEAPNTTDTKKSCESEGSDLNFILCPLLTVLDKAIDQLDRSLVNVLTVPNAYFENDPNIPNESGDKLEDTWRRMRNISYVVLVPIILIMVISTALGFEFVSAYTVKRALPRFIAAIVFIALSWEISKFLVVLTNDVGSGIYGLISSSFAGDSDITLAQIFNPKGDSAAAFTGLLLGLGGGLAILSIGIILSYALVTIVALLMGFVLLSLRQMLIVFLMLMGPLAILAWIFPGNDKMWKLWWGSFTKLLMLFPIIAALIAIGKSFSVVVGSTDDSLVTTTIKLVAYIGPYFFIPAAFKYAGGVFGNLAGMVNDRQRGLFDRQKKYRGEKMSQNWQKTRNYQRFAGKNAVSRGLRDALGAATNPRDLIRGREGVRAGKRTGRTLMGAAAFENDATIKANMGDDNFLLALANDKLANDKLSEARTNLSRATSQEDIDKYTQEIRARENGLAAARRVSSRKTTATRQAAANALFKTGYQLSAGRDGYNEMSNIVRDITGSDQNAYAAAMNEAQYHLKTAMRFDLGGINNGAGYSDDGLKKASLYQLANAKTESIKAPGRELLAKLQAGDASVLDKAAVWRKELEAMLPNSTGANRNEIVEQIRDLDNNSMLEVYLRTPTGNTRTITVRDPGNPNVLVNRTVSETLGDVAERTARTYQRPDPNNIT